MRTPYRRVAGRQDRTREISSAEDGPDHRDELTRLRRRLICMGLGALGLFAVRFNVRKVDGQLAATDPSRAR
jgi:hypothetical protein